MDSLAKRIAIARDAAAAQEGDIRLKELISAMIIDADPSTGNPTYVSVHAHFRAWMRYFRTEDLDMLRGMSDYELAETVANWIQGAIDSIAQLVDAANDVPRQSRREERGWCRSVPVGR